MKTLTIWQPWSTLIMLGAKPYEFRRWDYRTRERGLFGQRIVIHAGARAIKRDEIDDVYWRVKDGSSGMVPEIALPLLERIYNAVKCQGVVPLAVGLGTATIGQPQRCVDLFKGIVDSDRIDHHMWAWPLTDIERWDEPVPMRGAQGFWTWPMKVAAPSAPEAMRHE